MSKIRKPTNYPHWQSRVSLLTVGVGRRRRNLTLLGDTLHGSHGRKSQDDRQRIDETLEKSDHDRELAQGCVVAVEARQKENLFSRNDVSRIGKAAELDVVGSIGKLFPLCGVEGKAVWVLFCHALGQRFTWLGGNDLVPNRFSFSGKLVVHYSLCSIAVTFVFEAFHWIVASLYPDCSRLLLIGMHLMNKRICHRATKQSDAKKESYLEVLDVWYWWRHFEIGMHVNLENASGSIFLCRWK